jgi:hypothetical protein
MAENLNLNNFPASGVYTIEIDESQNFALPLTTGRLIIGSSETGPFNTVVRLNDYRAYLAVYGDKDKRLEKNGSFFHRAIEIALREGPVYAMNVLPLDTNDDVEANLDKSVFTTWNSESASNNTASLPTEYPIIEFFNRQRLWFASTDQLNKSKNLALGDDFLINPGGFGQTSIASNKILSFVNTGKRSVTIWVRRSDVRGYDVTAQEWYAGFSGDIEKPAFVHADDFISDYFVEVIAVEGDWTNSLKLSKDPIYKQFFDADGLRLDKMVDFLALRSITTISRVSGCLIPEFTDQDGIDISIDTLCNRSFPTTGILCALDAEKLDLIDLEEDVFNDVEVMTHRIDIIGHGYDELEGQDIYTADDGTDNDDPTPLIDTLAYKSPADAILHYKVSIEGVESGDFYTPTLGVIDADDIIKVTGPGDIYLAAMENSKLYKAYVDGYIKTGDIATDASGGTVVYLKIEDGFSTTLSGNEVKFIKIFAYQDISLLNQTDYTLYTVGSDEVSRIVRDDATNFKHVFDLTDTNYFTNFVSTPPNVLVLGINAANTAEKATIDEFIRPGHYIKARISGTSRSRLLRIISVQSQEELSPSTLTYTVTTIAPFDNEIDGIDTTGNELHVYKGIHNYVDVIRGQYHKGFKVRKGLLPNGTALRQQEILSYLFESTNIPEALADVEILDYRYLVDSYEGEISQSSKYSLAKIAAENGKVLALLNDPSIRQFERSVDPSFIDQNIKLVSSQLISEGGDLSLNPSFTFKFAEEDIRGIPLSSYAAYFFPYMSITEAGKVKQVPPAAYVSNVLVRKFKAGNPFVIAAGKRGVINDPEVIGPEIDLTDRDRGYLEPIGHNLIVRRRGFGTLIYSNNTAFQRVGSALNNLHVRDSLITLERDIERILTNFLFDFNDEIIRLRVRTVVENYLDSVVAARGLSGYEVIFDTSNNDREVLEANSAVIDIRVDFPRGIHKFINRITLTRVGGELSSESTGFTPSF